jgi:uncharacterized membrane protein YfcA
MLAVGLLLSALIGSALGLLGGGGSILTVPTMHYVFGLAAHEAIATSLAVVAITGLVALIPYARAGRVQWRIGLWYAGASMAGAYGAARVARYLPSTVLLVGFGAVMLVTAVGMLRGRATAAPPGYRAPVAALAAQAIAVGAIAGLVGAGGGFLIVPSLVMVVRLPMPQAVGTSLLVIVMNSTAAFAGTSADVPVHGRLIAVVAGTAAVGSIAGAYLASWVRPDGLRALFGWFVLIAGIIVFGKELPRMLGYQVILARDWPWMLVLAAILGSAAVLWRLSPTDRQHPRSADAVSPAVRS